MVRAMPGDAIHHAHEPVHQRAGKYEIRAVNLARDSMWRLFAFTLHL